MSEEVIVSGGPVEVLERYFGFAGFLEGQEEVVSALLAGRDAMVVMPTGAGKSLCYQLPALVMDGVTLVVSPLISLMKDQVDALEGRGVPVTMINSTVGAAEQRERIARMREGGYKLVYVAPERFRHRAFVEALGGVGIALFAVDEAHCLSQWGHDFRPDYLRLGAALEELGRPQVAVFTATATPEVRGDIAATLKLRDPYVGLSGFERPNLSLAVRQVSGRREKLERVMEVIRGQGTGIVYAATRRSVEEVAGHLAERGVRPIVYHGGLGDAEREEAQDRFMGGGADVVVATNAFGMGIDRSDVRFVVHFDVPGSIEAYYQEAGRAGRDGEPSVCELLFNYADTRTQEFFIEGNNPGREVIVEVYDFLRRYADERHQLQLPVQEMAERIGLDSGMQLSAALAALGRAGYVGRFDVPGERARGTVLRRPDAGGGDLDLDWEALAEKERRDRAKLGAMVKFCYAAGCRQGFILRYFGQDEVSPCGSCDNCGDAAGEGGGRAGSEAEVTGLRKALSGVARTNRRVAGGWQPRFGKGRVVAMLVGSRAKEVTGAGLDQLSTYGILRSEGSAYVHQLLREAERAGLVRTETSGEYPLLGLTDRGDRVMRDGGEVVLSWPQAHGRGGRRGERAGSEAGARLEELGFDALLFEKLKARRAEIARTEGIPAYRVFSNQTLEGFARLKPSGVEQGMAVHGVGPAKAERYLEEFLEVVRAHSGGTD